MKILITGCNGQLGRHLLSSAPVGWSVTGMSREELDITNRDATVKTLAEFRPDILINAAAYTAVDRAEEDREAAYAVNATGAGNLALGMKLVGGRMIHVSTDFVFDGRKSYPYLPSDETLPVSVYGASKLAGEHQVLQLLEEKAAVVRTAWVYSRFSGNFVLTMLHLMREKDEIGVVGDQIGTPTWAGSLADAVWDIARAQDTVGIYHKTDAGVASWYDFAVAIYEEAGAMGLLDREVDIRPIMTVDYPTPARRPSYSVLNNSRINELSAGPPRHWRQSLRLMLKELA